MADDIVYKPEDWPTDGEPLLRKFGRFLGLGERSPDEARMALSRAPAAPPPTPVDPATAFLRTTSTIPMVAAAPGPFNRPPAPEAAPPPAAPPEIHPAVKAHLARKFAVGQSADMGALPPAFQHLPSSDAPPSPEDDLKTAQDQSRRRFVYERAGDDLRSAANIMTAGVPNSEQGVGRRLSADVADRPVVDFLKRREVKRKGVEDAMAKKFAVDAGMAAPGDEVNAEGMPVLQAGLTKKHHEEGARHDAAREKTADAQAAERAKKEDAQAAETKRWHDMENAREWAKVNALRDKSEKEKAPKNIPPSEAGKLATMGESLNAITQAEDQYTKTGPLSPIQNRKYELTQEALSPTIAAGAAPAARENAQLMQHFVDGMPGKFTPNSTGKDYFHKLRGTVKSNLDAHLAELEAGGYSPNQVAELRRRGEAMFGAQSPGHHPQDAQALAWAKANPNDPRASAIMKANGG